MKRLLFLVLLVSAAPVAAQRPDTTTSPFAGFQTRILRNGLKVWFKQAKGFPDVSVSVGMSFGSDEDPPGKEQLAHFTEHMAFSDHNGMTEEQIKQALDEKGGSRNGLTGQDFTYYFARVARPHGLFALDWLYGIMAPKDMRPSVVDKQRDPVLIEIGARPRGIDDWLAAKLIDPPMLRTPGFWKREFGMATQRDRDVDLWRSTHGIDSADLRRFYDSHYVPGAMTLTIIGDLAPDAVWALIDTTFATLPARQATLAQHPLVDPKRESKFFQWQFASLIDYREAFKTYARNAHDDIALEFIARYLGERLNNRLRFGAHKAVYGISVSATRRGTAGTFDIDASVNRGELAYVRSTVQDEIDRLRNGTVSDSEFTATQSTVTRKILASTNNSLAVEVWIQHVRLFDRDEFTDFPDLLTQMSHLTKNDVRDVASRVMAPEHHYLWIMSVAPIPRVVVYLAIALLVVLAFRWGRRALIRPLPMTRLRYVARIKGPLLFRMTAIAVYAVVVLFLLRVAIYIGTLIAERWVLAIDSFYLQWSLLALVIVAGVLYLVGAAALMPSKVLVFDNGLAIKFRGYRSTWIPAADIDELSMIRIDDLYRQRGLPGFRSTWILTPALWSPALYIRLKSGRAYLLKSRDTSELLSVLKGLTSQPAN